MLMSVESVVTTNSGVGQGAGVEPEAEEGDDVISTAAASDSSLPVAARESMRALVTLTLAQNGRLVRKHQ